MTMRATIASGLRGTRRGVLSATLPSLLLAFALALVSGRSAAGPAVDLHQLHWFVHVDLIDAGAGRDLAYWQDVIDASVASANSLLEGRQGPSDRACCTRLTRMGSVSIFGVSGDGRDVLDTQAEQNYFNTAGGSGSAAFLIDSMTYCGGSAPSAVGCAERPSCDGTGGDNPNLWMVVTVDAFDDEILAAVTAHERGHNACLGHVAAAECQVMQATVFSPGLGACLAASECTNYRAARTTTSSGAECKCHTTGGAIEPDGLLCSSEPVGLCSGGLCGRGADLGAAGVRLIAAGTPGTAGGGPPETAVAVSTLSGHWSVLGQFTPTNDDVRALEYAHDSATLYGIVPTVGDDRVVTIDPDTGLVTATVGTLANGADEIVALAYDPGDTNAAGDDRLLVIEVGTLAGELRAISPSTPSVSTLLGSLPFAPSSAALFTGLAYDSIHDQLFAASPFGPNGLYVIDLTSCPPSPCNVIAVEGSLTRAGLFRDDASLAFSPATGMLYQIGTSWAGERTFYDVVDPVTGTSVETLSLDVFTPAGLAAVPEPISTISWLSGVLGVIVAYRARYGRILRLRG